MPTMVSGIRGTGNILSNRRVIDMARKIALLEPDKAPLLRLMQGADEGGAVLTKSTCSSPKFEWLEDELGPAIDAINSAAGHTAAATVLTVDNGNYFTVGDVVKVPRTAEVMRVTAQTSTTITVTRSFGGSPAAALVDNDPIVIIGNASEEGATSRAIKTTQEVAKFNYCQIFRKPFGVTNTEKASELYGGPDLPYQRMKKAIEHAIDMERAFLFGEKNEDTTGTHPLRTTGGILEFITTNIRDAGGTLTELEWEDFLRTVFRYGSKRKVAVCAPLVIGALNSFAKNKLRVDDMNTKQYGMDIVDYVSPHGKIKLISHWLLEGDVYGGYGIALDMENIKYRYLSGNGENRDTKLKTNIQANDEDSEKDEYISECGLEMKLEKTHGLLIGVTSF